MFQQPIFILLWKNDETIRRNTLTGKYELTSDLISELMVCLESRLGLSYLVIVVERGVKESGTVDIIHC